MNPAVALLIASLSCQDPALTFREFYAAKLNGAPMLGANGEIISQAVRREMDAAADFLDYRAGRMEKCR
jgi:hypothetical protein